MRALHALLLLVAAVCLRCGEDASILFIGNSLTYFNDLPQMVAGLAAAGGRGGLLVDRIAVGGATLEKHWKEGKALERIRSRPWTWIVLQEQSATTYADAVSFNTHVRLFLAAIAERKARPVLYQTWALKGELPRQDAISAAYRSAAVGTDALVVPAGEAFRAWRGLRGDDALFRDDRHPTPLGTYLTACCFYSVLFGRDPTGLPGDVAKLDPAAAGELQRLAWAAR